MRISGSSATAAKGNVGSCRRAVVVSFTLRLLPCLVLLTLLGLSFCRVTRVMHVGAQSSTGCFIFDGTVRLLDSRGPGMRDLIGKDGTGHHWLFEFEPVPRPRGMQPSVALLLSLIWQPMGASKSGAIFHRSVFIPIWMLVALTAIPPAVSILRYFRRPDTHGCTRCGYDLRATPDRCPECGYVPEKERATA